MAAAIARSNHGGGVSLQRKKKPPTLQHQHQQQPTPNTYSFKMVTGLMLVAIFGAFCFVNSALTLAPPLPTQSSSRETTTKAPYVTDEENREIDPPAAAAAAAADSQPLPSSAETVPHIPVAQKLSTTTKDENDDDDSAERSFPEKLTEAVAAAAAAASTPTVDSSTGTLFGGHVVRQYEGTRLSWPSRHDAVAKRTSHNKNNNNNLSCDKWSVVTTIFAPTDAVRRAAALSDGGWCIVIVADTKTPVDYVADAHFDQATLDRNAVHYLSVAEQQEWADGVGSRMGDFVRAIPLRHFARKNIGYLYAIHHGAKFVFDFDDDNILALSSDGNGDDKDDGHVLTPLVNETHVTDVRIPVLGHLAFNHHPLMGGTAGNLSWARGFPLDKILDETTHGNVPVQTRALSMDKVAVMQYCADSNPDIDAIHRLTKPLPMNFDPHASPVVVPSRTYSPYNAQATVHTAASLWATLLPATVPGRVSDIWRGYFAQRLFHDADLSLVFLPPRIRQDRNEHSYLADMRAELDLYFKTDKLLEFLNDWQPADAGLDTIPARMEALWIDLYERSYIEVDDVKVLQLWLQALIETGYEFPEIKRERYTNVMLMGQFNFAPPADRDAIYWVQKWRESFRHVQVRGPFDETQVEALTAAGIDVYAGDEGKGGEIFDNGDGKLSGKKANGFYSPMSNLANALEQQSSVTGIDGVLYIHDDAFANANILGQREDPTSAVFSSGNIRTYNHEGMATFEDASPKGKAAFRVLENGDYVLKDDTVVSTSDEAKKEIKKTSQWMHWHKCLEPLRNLALDPKSKPLREDDGTLIVPTPSLSDFMFVPTKYASQFKQAADLMMEHGVYLECGMPTIVQMLRHVIPDLEVDDSVALCEEKMEVDRESREKGLRGSVETMESCLEKVDSEMYGVYHPFKISKQGLEVWGDLFDRITFADVSM